MNILLIVHSGANFSEILIGIQTFSFKKMHLKMSSAKWRPLCLGFNVLTSVRFIFQALEQLALNWCLLDLCRPMTLVDHSELNYGYLNRMNLRGTIIRPWALGQRGLPCPPPPPPPPPPPHTHTHTHTHTNTHTQTHTHNTHPYKTMFFSELSGCPQ